MRQGNKTFLIILPFLIFVAASVLGLSIRNFNLVEKSGGCGCDFENTTGEFVAEKKAYFLSKEITPPLTAFAEPEKSVLGENSGEEKWIEVDLSEQKIIAWEGENKFLESAISSGKWNRTPKGVSNIWAKFKYTKMSGGNKEDNTYYYLPNVPYTMYFYKGFGLHGTYWHDNFGEPMSHGCVNLPTLVAEKLFYWTTPVLPTGKKSVFAESNSGTRVVVHD
ncbi:L,D-transpeptidase [Candidatus Microgenomates bacterium]|nr:MAG: L,D-transpeptidase [Candidatus Microgenomates bacterium]